MRRASRVFLAGDYLGTLYTESAITTGFSAAQEAVSLLATDRQQNRRAERQPTPNSDRVSSRKDPAS